MKYLFMMVLSLRSAYANFFDVNTERHIKISAKNIQVVK